MTSSTIHQIWKKGDYLISMDPYLLPISKVNDALASEHMYWAKSLPEEVMRETLRNSLCFGLYKVEAETEDPAFVGMARLITDKTTFVYLTDVYVDPKFQGEGLGTWLVSCIQDIIEAMPHLRRSILFTGDWKRSVPFYNKIMHMEVVETKAGEGLAFMEKKGPGHPHFPGAA
ncbi:putative GNAT family N-acetyltransferase [Rhexocercosporidium sp. MPI-PUGE-AT-0058]|nr:putative GNAT family N-acetyltransferase [Rhexocercosporidium sp. MPI-PUGE-AT-0058]